MAATSVGKWVKRELLDAACGRFCSDHALEFAIGKGENVLLSGEAATQALRLASGASQPALGFTRRRVRSSGS
jgi:hypothetical protein